MPNFKQFYPGLSFFAKHFLVRSLDSKKVKRHYTSSNAMIPSAYKEYIRLLKIDLGDSKDSRANSMTPDFNAARDTNQINLTVKNYNRKSGLSWRF